MSPRVIVGKALNFSENDIIDSIVSIENENDVLSGFSFAWLRKNANGFLDTFSYSNLTDDSYYGNSIIDELLVNNINVSLIGKTSTMFNKYNVEKFYGNTDECMNLLSKNLVIVTEKMNFSLLTYKTLILPGMQRILY